MDRSTQYRSILLEKKEPDSLATDGDKGNELDESLTCNVLFNLLPSFNHQSDSSGRAHEDFVSGKKIMTNPSLKNMDYQKSTSQTVETNKSSLQGNTEQR